MKSPHDTQVAKLQARAARGRMSSGMPLGMVPPAYLDAKKRGDSETQLMEVVNGICLKALRTVAAKENTPAPDTVDAHVVALTLEMYEHILSSAGQNQ